MASATATPAAVFPAAVGPVMTSSSSSVPSRQRAATVTGSTVWMAMAAPPFHDTSSTPAV